MCISSLKSENYLRLTDFKIMQKIWYLELRASFILYEKLLFLKLYCLIEITCYLSTRKTVLPFSMKTWGGEVKTTNISFISKSTVCSI